MQAATAKPTATDAPTGYWVSFRRMPLVLQAFAVFVAAMSIASLSVNLFPALNRRVFAYTGGGLPLNLFLVYFAFAVPVAFRGYRMFAMLPILAAIIFAGVRELVSLNSQSYSTIAGSNPFLRYEPQRPIFTIVVPLFWTLMLFSPAVWRWIRATGEDRNRAQRMNLRDYFYLTFVIAVCTALSLGLVQYATDQIQAAAVATPPAAQPQP